MREEWRRATGSAVEGHAELARRCKAADAEAASLRSEFEAKVGVAEAALAKALEAAAEAGAAAAAMEEERDALVEELRHGAREGEVAQLRRQLQEAEAEAAEGGIAKVRPPCTHASPMFLGVAASAVESCIRNPAIQCQKQR